MLSRVVCLFSVGVLMAQTAVSPQDNARKVLDLLIAKKYAEIVPMVSANSKAANTVDLLSKKIPDAWGAAENIGTPEVRAIGTNSVVSIPVKFAHQDVTVVMSFNEKGEIGVIQTQIDPWKPPSYAKADAFKDRAVTIGAGTKFALSGTLSVPVGAGPFPGVVLVHDSGAGDRDESTGMVKVFRDLAQGLASKGVVVLRYEKRTRAYPAVTQANDYTAETEIIDDAVLAAGVLRAQPEVKPGKVFEVGFGLGGYLMPRIAEADGKLAGVVIVNGNERPLEDVALDEAQYLIQGMTPEQAKSFGPQMAVITESAAKIKKLTQADDDTVALLGMRGNYLLDLKGYDPAGQAKLVGVPMYILQGERDFQVNMKDFNAWKNGLKGMNNATFKSYPALDHVLVAGSGRSAEADYRKPGQHVDQQVVDDIAAWVSK